MLARWSLSSLMPRRTAWAAWTRAAGARAVARRAAPPPLPVVYHPLFSAPQLAPGHRFPMGVFKVIHDRLLDQGIIHPCQVHVPAELPTDEELSIVHAPEYLAALSSLQLDDARVRRIGFGSVTRTATLVARTKSEVAGTLLAAELALERGLATSCAGGTHHAFPGFGSGFCLLNDLAFTAHTLLRRGLVQRILILDLDVHQGDGTAVCCAGNPSIFTLSLHAESNFPARKQQSSMDVALPDGTGDAEYLSAVAAALAQVLASFRPDLVLYDAGVDIHVDDALGRLSVSDEGLRRRELLVMDAVLAAGVPLAGYVGGGYAADLATLAERHMVLHRAAMQMWREHGL